MVWGGEVWLNPETRMSSHWCSADAMRDRGELMIDDDSLAAVGSEPAVPTNLRTPYGEWSVARVSDHLARALPGTRPPSVKRQVRRAAWRGGGLGGAETRPQSRLVGSR